MTSDSRKGSRWPTAAQELLLRAAVLDGEQALAAWRRWRRLAPLDDVDPASTQLLPLAYRNLLALGADDPAMGWLKEAYRQSWARNHLLFRAAAGALGDLHGAGIPTLLLKGAALSLLHYRDTGARPMADVDVLVPLERAEEACRVLEAGGWAPQPHARRLIAMRHAGCFSAGPGREVDLHWYSLFLSAPDDDFWESAVPIELGGVSSLTLEPADQLLHVCMHGAFEGSVHWVADAITVIHSAPLDWERLVDRATARRASTCLSDALRFLRLRLGAPVPPAVIDRLAAVPSPWFERAGYRAAIGPAGPMRSLRIAWDRYRRLSLVDGGGPKPSFLQTLQGLWGDYRDRRQLFADSIRGVARWVRRMSGSERPRAGGGHAK